MGEFRPLIDLLADAELDSLSAENLGDLSLIEVADILKQVRSELELADAVPYEEMPQSAHGAIMGPFKGDVETLLRDMRAYGQGTQNLASERTRLSLEAQKLRDRALTTLRPYLRFDEVKVRADLADLQTMRTEMAALIAESKSQQSALATSSASQAASDLSTFYQSQAEAHRGIAQRFLVYGGVSGVILTGLTVWLFFASPPDYTATDSAGQWIEVIRATVARLAILSLAGFVVAFCARNYRVNMHLEVLNKRRENALNTFGLMQASVTGDDARNIVVSELVRSVFTSDDTGYLTGETERTIIESPGGGGILSAVSAMSRTRDS